jgi:hypothetical protein
VLFHHDTDSRIAWWIRFCGRRGRNLIGICDARGNGQYAGSSGRPHASKRSGNPRGAAARSAIPAKVSGVTEGEKEFADEELQVTTEAPGGDDVQTMRWYVVRIDAGADKGQSAVGVVFTD